MLRALCLFVSVAAFVASLGACGDEIQFTSRHADEVAPNDRVTVTVLGVFKDGIMSQDAWEVLGPRLSRGFHGAACAAAYFPAPAAGAASTTDAGAAPAHPTTDETLAHAIEDYARDNGVTDDLLAELAPMAEGDLIVTFTIAGHPPALIEAGTSFPRTTPAPRPMRGGMMPQRQRAAPPGPRSNNNAYEVAASFYSRKYHRSVALLAMTYRGASEDDALTLFVNKLSAFFPNATCAGVASAAIDPGAHPRAREWKRTASRALGSRFCVVDLAFAIRFAPNRASACSCVGRAKNDIRVRRRSGRQYDLAGVSLAKWNRALRVDGQRLAAQGRARSWCTVAGGSSPRLAGESSRARGTLRR